MALLCRQHINQPVFPIILSMEIRVDNNLVIISQNLCNCFDILMTFCLFQQLRGKGMPKRVYSVVRKVSLVKDIIEGKLATPSRRHFSFFCIHD